MEKANVASFTVLPRTCQAEATLASLSKGSCFKKPTTPFLRNDCHVPSAYYLLDTPSAVFKTYGIPSG